MPVQRRGDRLQRIDLVASLDPATRAAVQHVALVAEERGDSACLVGGLPRDLLLGRRPGPDVDIVVEGDAESLARAVADRYGGRVRVHRRFGTAKWVTEECVIDLVTARAEHYSAPTVLPVVEPGSLESDLLRRDFTVNALALDLNPERFGAVVDLCGGLADLRAGRIRVLHDQSFREDPTRILRAVRLETRLGFQIEPSTGGLIPSALGLIERVSGIRLLNELRQLFAEADPIGTLDRLVELGVLPAIHPALGVGERTGRLLDSLPATWSFWRAAAPELSPPRLPPASHRLLLWLGEHGSGGLDAAHRLRLPGRDQARLAAVVRLHAEGVPLTKPGTLPADVYHYLKQVDPQVLFLTWHGSANPTRRRHILDFASRLAGVRTSISGADLAAMGVQPGPAFGRVLRRILDARLNGDVASRDGELALARSILAAELAADDELAGSGKP